ncbi:hypothetical protein BGZ83_008523 [Gryganskiella cystojenkinii]|nr:hypothetical protein BGZ83_008523 [Gryganskiella cystojenkinii]
MPARNGGASSSLPFFNTGNTPSSVISRIPLPRACLSPRIFLSCILVTFTVSWLLLYSSAWLSLGSPTSASLDSEDWTSLEQQHLGSSSSSSSPSSPANSLTKTLRWRNTTLASTFTCETITAHKTSTPPLRSGFNRATVCTVQNLCVDAERDSDSFPQINVVSADPASDAYFRPVVLNEFPAKTYRFVDETIFIYSKDPTNRRTWTLNNLLPLHSMWTRYGGTTSSWFMRVAGLRNKDYEPKLQLRNQDQDRNLETLLLAPHGREIVLDGGSKPLSEHQIHPPSKTYPTCFAKAVIGLQSRCTRPFCENLVGGEELTVTLQNKVLETLGPTMIRFQKPDPDIIHPRPVITTAGKETPVTIAPGEIVKGEFTPRSKINVALLGRYGNTSIPNMQSLENSLLDKGFSVQTIHLDYPADIGLAQAAQLFQKQNILIAPQGDGLGYADWMEPGSVVVSILPRFTRSSKIYTDRMMAFGKRLFAWDCQDEGCVQADRDLAHECIEAVEASPTYAPEDISAADFEDFANMKKDFRSQSTTWKAIADCYTKEVSRRIHSDELVRLIEDLAKDFTFTEPTPLESRLVGRAAPSADDEDDDDEVDVDGFVEIENPDEGDEEADDDSTEEDDENGDPSESVEDLDKEGVVRIQDDKVDGQEKEDEESNLEDINAHEYDEPATEDKSIEDKNPSGETTGLTPSNTVHVPVPPDSPKDVPPKTPITLPLPIKDQQQQQVRQPPKGRTNDHAYPSLDFVEFCKRGLCCGSAKSTQPVGATGAKGLTPCATSMSTVVFSSKGVWNQEDDTMTVQETQAMVWQVDLGRSLAH